MIGGKNKPIGTTIILHINPVFLSGMIATVQVNVFS